MRFKCMKFKANFNLPQKEKPPQVVCLRYIENSEFYDLSKPLPSNAATKPIKIKPTLPKPEILSIFNIPPPPITEIEPKQESNKPTEPSVSIPKDTNCNEVAVPSFEKIPEPVDSKSLLPYSTENEFEINDNQEKAEPSFINELEYVLASFSIKQEEVPPSFSTEQEEDPPIFSAEQKEVPSFISTEQEEDPPIFSDEQKEVPSFFSTEQKADPPIFSDEQEEIPSFFSTEQQEVPPSHISKQVEASASHKSEQIEVLNNEQEEIISSEDDTTAHNSPYQVRYAKKPKPNYEPKPSEDSEISDYESEDDDLDLTDNNNNQDAYSSQAANIFFAGVEAEPSPRSKKLPKNDDEV